MVFYVHPASKTFVFAITKLADDSRYFFIACCEGGLDLPRRTKRLAVSLRVQKHTG